jgi:hypothetical protein
VQTGTSNMSRAVSGSSVIWKPQLRADWARDGYGADGTIDDLTGQASQFRITHGYDDGAPDEVSYLQSPAVPGMSAALSGRDPVSTAKYFSPVQTSSPVYGYERDLAPVKMDQGVLTAGGLENIRLFTGQMQGTPVKKGRASLIATSKTRLDLRALVQPPVYEYGDGTYAGIYGLTCTWPVSYALHQCGVYPSPPANAYTRLHVPMHGGGNPFIPNTNPMLANGAGTMIGLQTDPETLQLEKPWEPRHIRGPYVGAVDSGVTTSGIKAMYGRLDPETQFGPGDDLFSKAGSRGRIEFWIKGDACNMNTTPGGSGQFHWGSGLQSRPFLAGMELINANGTYILAGVHGPDRRVFLNWYDITTLGYFSSSLAVVPTDNAWHFIGIAWDFEHGQCWFRVDGTQIAPTPTFTMTDLPATENGQATATIVFTLPVAEFQVSSGSGADVVENPEWLYNKTWTRRGFVYPSQHKLMTVAEPVPREAWEYISSFARAEQAALRIDENDNIYYMPRGYFATAALQSVAQTITTTTDAAIPDLDLDASRIRNISRVTYNDTRMLPFVSGYALDYRQVIELTPGLTIVTIPLDRPTYRISGGVLTNLTAAQVDGSDPSPPGWSFISVNETEDGSGAYGTAAQVEATITYWDAGNVEITFNNLTTSIWFLVNNTTVDLPYLGVIGGHIIQSEAYEVKTYDSSIATRGYRALVVRLPQIQRREEAARVASRLVGDWAFPVAAITSVDVFGDPRRQPTDLLQFVDPAETGASGYWRARAITHTIDEADYQQEIVLETAKRVGRWGDDVSRWGRIVWAGLEVIG